MTKIRVEKIGSIRRVERHFMNSCVPATLAQFFVLLDEDVSILSWEDIFEAMGVTQGIMNRYGVGYDRFAKAVLTLSEGKLVPMYMLNTPQQVVEQVVGKMKLPLGVDWQGIFKEGELLTTSRGSKDGRDGHVAVITRLHRSRGRLRYVVMLDSCLRCYGETYIPWTTFKGRWWDIGYWTARSGKQRGKVVKMRDDRLSFVVVRAREENIIADLIDLGFNPDLAHYLWRPPADPY